MEPLEPMEPNDIILKAGKRQGKNAKPSTIDRTARSAVIADKLIAERPIPDFVEYVCEKSLKEVKPEVVDVIR
jgi:hypothetical protein